MRSTWCSSSCGIRKLASVARADRRGGLRAGLRAVRLVFFGGLLRLAMAAWASFDAAAGAPSGLLREYPRRVRRAAALPALVAVVSLAVAPSATAATRGDLTGFADRVSKVWAGRQD